MIRRLSAVAVLAALVLVPMAAVADDYEVAAVSEGPPADKLAEPIAATLSKSGVKVTDGDDTLVEFWLCAEWPVVEGFQQTADRIYPFTPGQLIGVMRFADEGADFRDQEIESGVYTVRYGLQPIDGAHVGTSPTRDFLLLLPAGVDKSAEPMESEKLSEVSAEVVESSHPAILGLPRLAPFQAEEAAIREDERNEWWILHVVGKGKAGGESSSQPLNLVIVGHADE